MATNREKCCQEKEEERIPSGLTSCPHTFNIQVGGRVYLQSDFSSNLTPLPGGFQGDVFNVLFMTRSNHSEWPQLLHKCRSNDGTTVDDGPVSSKGRAFVSREGSNLMTGKSIEHISLRDSINYLDW